MNPYQNVDGADFARIAHDFDFKLPQLGKVDFPEQFIRDYVDEFSTPDTRSATGITYTLAPLNGGAQLMMFDGVNTPGQIYSLTRIIAESAHLPEGAPVFPAGYAVVGRGFGIKGEIELLLGVAEGTAEHGKIFLWPLAHDEPGSGDNTQALVEIAPDLASFLAALTTEEVAKIALAALAR